MSLKKHMQKLLWPINQIGEEKNKKNESSDGSNANEPFIPGEVEER